MIIIRNTALAVLMLFILLACELNSKPTGPTKIERGNYYLKVYSPMIKVKNDRYGELGEPEYLIKHRVPFGFYKKPFQFNNSSVFLINRQPKLLVGGLLFGILGGAILDTAVSDTIDHFVVKKMKTQFSININSSVQDQINKLYATKSGIELQVHPIIIADFRWVHIEQKETEPEEGALDEPVKYRKWANVTVLFIVRSKDKIRYNDITDIYEYHYSRYSYHLKFRLPQLVVEGRRALSKSELQTMQQEIQAGVVALTALVKNTFDRRPTGPGEIFYVKSSYLTRVGKASYLKMKVLSKSESQWVIALGNELHIIHPMHLKTLTLAQHKKKYKKYQDDNPNGGD